MIEILEKNPSEQENTLETIFHSLVACLSSGFIYQSCSHSPLSVRDNIDGFLKTNTLAAVVHVVATSECKYTRVCVVVSGSILPKGICWGCFFLHPGNGPPNHPVRRNTRITQSRRCIVTAVRNDVDR